MTENSNIFFYMNNINALFLRSLERDAYDHIAATYYLLMERRFRKLLHQEFSTKSTNNVRKQSAPPNNAPPMKPQLEPLVIPTRYVIIVTCFF